MSVDKDFILPDGWQVDLLKNLCEKPTYGYTASATTEGNAKFLRITDIEGYRVNWNTVPNCEIDNGRLQAFKLEEDDIVFARIGATTGKSYIIKNPPANAVYASYLIRVRPNKNELHPDYLYYYFNSKLYWEQIDANKRNNLKMGVNGSVLQQLKIIQPPYKEQKNIAHILSTLQKAIEKQESLVATTQALKKSLLHQLFTQGVKGEALKETPIGVMPESWEVTKLEDIYQFTSKPRETNINATPSVPFIPMELVPDQSYYADKFILKEGAVLTSGTYIENGDLLLAKITPSFENGKQGVADLGEYYWGYATTEVIPIKAINDVSSTEYLFYYLLKSDVRKFLEDKMEGSTGRQRLGKSTIKELLIPFPKDVAEQKEIGSVFQKLDTKIDIHKKKKGSYENLFKTLLNELMTGKTRVHEVDFHAIPLPANEKKKLQLKLL